nr:uncharacterized protein LOC112058983 [Chrysemys picta bellii]
MPRDPTAPGTTAMQVEKVGCWRSGLDRPKSCREKFLQAWNEKLKLQPCPISPQVPNCPSPGSIPAQGQWPGAEPVPFSLKGALLHPSCHPGDNALYFLAVVTAVDHSGSTPVSFVAPGGCSGHTPRTPAGIRPCDKDPGPFYKELARPPLAWEGNSEEELLQICASDLLLGSSLRKRPRLLPPNRKMHVEVWKRKPASHPPEEGARSPVPLEYSHLVDAMAMTEPADISEVESFYRQFTPWPRRRGSCRSTKAVHAQTDSALPVRKADEAAPEQHSLWGAAGSGFKQHPKRAMASISTLILAAKRPRDTAWSEHLPPKKRYIQY